MHSTLLRYFSDWFHFPTLQSWNFEEPAKILVIDEVHIPTLLSNRPDFLDTIAKQSIIVLAANPFRQAILSKDIRSDQVEVLCKPFGPYKLARAICRALEKAALAVHPVVQTAYVEIQAPSRQTTAITSSSQLLPLSDGSSRRNVSALSPANETGKSCPSPRVVAAIRNRTLTKDVGPGPDGGFPFPTATVDDSSQGQQGSREGLTINLEQSSKPHELIRPPALSPPPSNSTNASFSALRPRPVLESMKTEPVNKDTEFIAPASALPTSAAGTVLVESPCRPPPRRGKPSFRKPRLLLVDDNHINLQMLHTYVRKKGYGDTLVQLATDGAQAFDTFKSQTHKGEAPDIVFMDVSSKWLCTEES